MPCAARRQALDDLDLAASQHGTAGSVPQVRGSSTTMGAANIRKEPTVPSFAQPDTIFLGLDVHRDSISVAVLHPGDRAPLTEKISTDGAPTGR
jgi:hypothetical protein